MGSLAMVLSDLGGVRGDRHICVAFGTLIHFFYGAAGLWMLGLGHAGFRAITAGKRIAKITRCQMRQLNITCEMRETKTNL